MTAGDGIDLDYSERAGFLVGKSAAIADWQHRKEVRAFAKLVDRLRVIKWQRANPGRRAEKSRRYHAKPEVKAHRNELARKRRAATAPESITCAECHAAFPRARKGPRPKFCGDACRQRAQYQAATPGARRVKLHETRTSRVRP